MQLASLALRGERFEEADRRFEDLVRDTDDSYAWLGLSCAKIGRFICGESTIDEVAAAFDFTRQTQQEEGGRRVVEVAAAQHAASAVATLIMWRAKLITAAGEVNQAALRAAAAGGISALTGSQSTSLFGSIASYNVFARCLDALQQSFADDGDIVKQLAIVDARITDLASFAEWFSADHSGAYGEALSGIQAVQGLVGGQPAVLPDPAVNAGCLVATLPLFGLLFFVGCAVEL